MNILEFKNKMEYAETYLDESKVIETVKKSIEINNNQEIKKGNYTLIIVIEELSELIQSILNYMHDENDIDNVIEEIADVYITLYHLKYICNVNLYPAIYNNNGLSIMESMNCVTNLIQSVCKLLRYGNDKDLENNIKEVYKFLSCIIEKLCIDTDDIIKAINIKCDRFNDKLNNTGSYN